MTAAADASAAAAADAGKALQTAAAGEKVAERQKVSNYRYEIQYECAEANAVRACCIILRLWHHPPKALGRHSAAVPAAGGRTRAATRHGANSKAARGSGSQDAVARLTADNLVFLMRCQRAETELRVRSELSGPTHALRSPRRSTPLRTGELRELRALFVLRQGVQDELVRLREEVDQRRGEWLRNAHSQLAQRVTESLAQAEGALQSLLLERERAEARCPQQYSWQHGCSIASTLPHTGRCGGAGVSGMRFAGGCEWHCLLRARGGCGGQLRSHSADPSDRYANITMTLLVMRLAGGGGGAGAEADQGSRPASSEQRARWPQRRPRRRRRMLHRQSSQLRWNSNCLPRHAKPAGRPRTARCCCALLLRTADAHCCAISMRSAAVSCRSPLRAMMPSVGVEQRGVRLVCAGGGRGTCAGQGSGGRLCGDCARIGLRTGGAGFCGGGGCARALSGGRTGRGAELGGDVGARQCGADAAQGGHGPAGPVRRGW